MIKSFQSLIDLMNRLKEEGRKKDADICSKALYCLNRMDDRHFKHLDKIEELETAIRQFEELETALRQFNDKLEKGDD